jgi:hypothetical protein
MQDKTAIGNNENANTPSKAFREYIESLVEEIVINKAVFNDHKKYLQRYSQEEGLDYAELEKNLTEFFETFEELKSKESKAIERFAKMLAKDCYLEESVVNNLVLAMNKAREGVKRRTMDETRCEAQEETVNEAAIQGFVNGHEYVDLGLPSGILWATCNVGANKPEEYGDYFSWGETCPNCEYNEDTNKYYEDFYPIKYTDKDHLKILQPEDDAARANWGADWRMPTKEEWEELRDNTTHEWTKQNGVEGWLFTANNGNSLFLPAAGARCDDEFFNAGDCGHYRSSSLYTDDPLLTWNFDCCSVNCDVYDGIRTDGESVRPVCSAPQN